jgi:(p)ppGpp synthase/HD superfamily hydrolase
MALTEKKTEKDSISAADAQRILAAALFAAKKHARQKRKGEDGEPYVNHLIEVAELIAGSSDALDTELVIAGLLHDTVEDAGVSMQELEERFGRDVAGLVAEVTDDKSLPKETRKMLQVQNAPLKSERAQTLKLADKISNLRSLLASPPAGWSLERKLQYFEWAKAVVDGLTSPNRLLKAEFDKTYSQVSQLKQG